jgi:hypothetical protein
MMIPLVLTTNFDVHVENAFEQMCLPHKLYVSRCPRKVLRRILNPKICGKTLPVLKIHGSIEDRPSIVITMRQAGRKLKADLAAVVQETLRSTPVLIVGYSGNDDDIFPEMLRVAAEAREVYWALWDNEKSLTSNIKVFKAACPNCTIIECDNKAILHDLAERVAKSSSVRQPDHHITPAEYVKRWIAGTPEECWINIFSELLLKTHCTDDSARAIAKETDTVRRTANDKWLLAKASANHGLAMSKLRDFEASVQSLLQAADHFMEMAHHREVVECLCNVVTETPLRPEWNGRSLASWSGDIAGRNYDPHQLGMYNLLAGVVFSEQRAEPKKLSYAENYLLVAAGYARKSGDTVLLIKCLDYLTQFFRSEHRQAEETECRAEVARLRGLLGIVGLTTSKTEGRILRNCDMAARRNFRTTIVGDAVIILIIGLILGSLGMLIVTDTKERILNFVVVWISGASIKLWNAKKASIKYRNIDST